MPQAFCLKQSHDRPSRRHPDACIGEVRGEQLGPQPSMTTRVKTLDDATLPAQPEAEPPCVVTPPCFLPAPGDSSRTLQAKADIAQHLLLFDRSHARCRAHLSALQSQPLTREGNHFFPSTPELFPARIPLWCLDGPAPSTFSLDDGDDLPQTDDICDPLALWYTTDTQIEAAFACEASSLARPPEEPLLRQPQTTTLTMSMHDANACVIADHTHRHGAAGHTMDDPQFEAAFACESIDASTLARPPEKTIHTTHRHGAGGYTMDDTQIEAALAAESIEASSLPRPPAMPTLTMSTHDANACDIGAGGYTMDDTQNEAALATESIEASSLPRPPEMTTLTMSTHDANACDTDTQMEAALSSESIEASSHPRPPEKTILTMSTHDANTCDTGAAGHTMDDTHIEAAFACESYEASSLARPPETTTLSDQTAPSSGLTKKQRKGARRHARNLAAAQAAQQGTRQDTSHITPAQWQIILRCVEGFDTDASSAQAQPCES